MSRYYKSVLTVRYNEFGFQIAVWDRVGILFETGIERQYEYDCQFQYSERRVGSLEGVLSVSVSRELRAPVTMGDPSSYL